jgi:hypothetical protein
MTKPRICGILLALGAAATVALVGLGPVAAADAPAPRLAAADTPPLGSWADTTSDPEVQLQLQKVETILHTGRGAETIDSYRRLAGIALVSNGAGGECRIDDKVFVRGDGRFLTDFSAGGHILGEIKNPTTISLLLDPPSRCRRSHVPADLHPVAGR